jgi:peptidoglycan/xylan/chitin deacetylase (PgdA/CDA1 family)
VCRAIVLLAFGSAPFVNAQPRSPLGNASIADSPGATSAPRIAFTFDDLPAHSALPPGETRLEIAKKIIAALRNAKVPPTYGFVNGVRIEEQPGDAAVLQSWIEAGNPLGNHGWSHMNLNQHTVDEFEGDVTRNEPVLNQWMAKQDWHWFRFPYLAEGDNPEKKAGIRAFLLQQNYKIAGVTMSFGDYLWNEPYARCMAKGDQRAIESLKRDYLAAADEKITYSRKMSQALYGRDIPYVLLMHIGAFDAEMLPKLLNLYESRGFRFVTLAEAESDPFYLEDTDLHRQADVDTLEGAMVKLHLPLPAQASFAPSNDLCR